MIVIDASAMLVIILGTATGQGLFERVFARHETLHAPELIDLEVAQVLRRLCLQGELETGRADVALKDFSNLLVARYAHADLLIRIWELRHNLTAYDAAYVALAEALDAPMLTRDARLAAASGHRARIELI